VFVYERELENMFVNLFVYLMVLESESSETKLPRNSQL